MTARHFIVALSCYVSPAKIHKKINQRWMHVCVFFWNGGCGGVSNEEILPRNLFISAFLPVCANVPLWLFVHGCSSTQVIDAS